MLESAADGPPRALSVGEVRALFDSTVEFWRSWLAGSTYTGRGARKCSDRPSPSKLMTYAPTGGLVAAPTAGLPEQIGGERNWDYRFTWVRDASFSVHALLSIGFVDEATQFSAWLGHRVRRERGLRRLPAQHHVSDRRFHRSQARRRSITGGDIAIRSPVRIGNGAAGQLQLDIYGEAMDASFTPRPARLAGIGQPGGRPYVRLLEWLVDTLGPTRRGYLGNPRRPPVFTYGRVMCWVAFDRAIRLATEHGLPAQLAEWISERDAIYEQVMALGFNADRQAFVQHYETDVLDAALLRMPHGRLRRATRSACGIDPAGHGQRAGDRQPRLPVQPERVARRAAW